MNRKNNFYSSGEFAKLNGINKRTLHYYNDIGLFCPEYVDENGYHYYSCFQFPKLELILTLRKIGMTIQEIREYISKPADISFTQMVSRQKELIDQSIQQLLETRNFLQQKSEKLEISLTAEHGKIEQIYLPEKKLLLSAPITGKYDQQDFSVAAEFSFRLKKIFHLYDSFGSRISTDTLLMRKMDRYDSFFAYAPDNSLEYDAIMPAGNYLRTFCIGNWDKLQEIYQLLLNYAQEHHLELTGYAYEEGLNELSIQKEEDYITVITIAYNKKTF